MERKNHAYLLFMLILSVLALAALAVEATLSLDDGTRVVLNYADTLVCTFSGFVASWFLVPGQARRESEFVAVQRDIGEIKRLLGEKAGCHESALPQDAAADGKPVQPC
jgi:hypothetical protein